MKTTNYKVRINPEAKAKAHFKVASRIPNEMLRASFEEAEAMLADPNIKGYATIEELNDAMDAADMLEGEYV